MSGTLRPEALRSIGGARAPAGLPGSLAAVLADPPREYSPAAIWWWSGEPLRRDRLRWQLERLVEGGVWNLVILNLAPSGPLFGSDADDPPFLSEAWWELLDGVCEDAAQLGARLWLYDQLGFSGADLQARLVQERPEFAGLWLPETGAGPPEERGFDYLGKEACATLLDRMHGEVERRLGRWLGSTIAGFFQDELPTLPTWSRGFEAAFAQRCGYELAPRLELLWRGVGEEAERVRHDYHATRAALAEEAFFKPLNAWHERHGMICGCDQQDPARAGDPVEGVQLYADYARTHRWFGAPGSDHHGDARIHASLAHLYERPRVWIEAFHSSGWGGTLEETFDWLVPWLRGGATLYNPHAVYATTKAGWWEWAPPSTDWRQPYWRHHGVFADAVARLCAALSLGRHVCDVAVLLPTANAQAGARLDGAVDPDAERAQATYRALVGDMAWFHQRPGTLDRLGLDADVIDDASLQRATIDAGDRAASAVDPLASGPLAAVADLAASAAPGDGPRLRVADEAYAAIVLPACTVLEDATADRLAAFAEAGGRVVAVGALPQRAVGTGAPDRDQAPGLTRLLSAFASGRASLIPAPVAHDDAGPGDAAVPGDDAGPPADAHLREALADVHPRVTASAPALVREVEGALLVFLTAASPSASEVEVDDPEGRGVGFGWLHPRIDFDPARYRRETCVRIAAPTTATSALLVSPFGGEPRPLAGEPDGDGVRFAVPFDDGPAALLVIPSPDAAVPGADAADPGADASVVAHLDEVWEMELVPMLENDWGDFARPASPGAPPLERWSVRHRHERAGEDGRRDGWAARDHDDDQEPWAQAHATFGPHAEWTGPAAPGDLPLPGDPAEGDPAHADHRAWRTATYSTSRGIHKDPVHQGGTLGPKGRVPEEFLDFGRAERGQAVHLRTLIDVPAGVAGTLAVGAAAAKRAWVDGAELPLSDDGGYLAVAPFALGVGRHLVELRLTAEHDGDLRAHLALVRDTEAYRRPEWIAADPAATRAGARVALTCETTLSAVPAAATVQVAAKAPCRLRVNGVEVGRQGGFDPYAEQDIPRVGRYDVAAQLRAGRNELTVELVEPADAAPSADGGESTVAAASAAGDPATTAVLVDALLGETPLASGTGWRASRDGASVPLALRRPTAGDPAALHLRRRPHPLPGAAWLDPDADDGTVLDVVPAVPSCAGAPRVEWLRFAIPPGTTRIEADAHGDAQLFVDGAEHPLGEPLPADDPSPPARTGALRIVTRPGFAGGAALAGPIRFAAGPGTIALGDWQQVGLPEYSGGVRYRAQLQLDEQQAAGRTMLDLGRVRGTAEVHVNGTSAGVRVCAPWTFDVTELVRPAGNVVEVLVLGTLGPYLDAVSPTHFVFDGQRTSGLLGPVVLRRD